MPTYAYACTSCDNRFEVQQSFSDSSLTDCPSCEGRVRKLFNSVGIVFKGSGFYRNDSRGTSGENGAKSSDSSSEKPSEKPSEKKKTDSTTSTTSTTAGPAKGKSTPASSSAA